MFEQVLNRIRGMFLTRPGQFRGEELRKLVRVRCQIPVYVRQGKDTCNGWIVDLGLEGLGLRTSRLLLAGENVQLRALLPPPVGEKWIEGRLQWATQGRGEKEFRAGASLSPRTESCWVEGLLAGVGLDEESGHNRRRAIRAQACFPLHLLGSGGANRELFLRDLSLTGVGFLSPFKIEAGKRIRLRLGPWQKLSAFNLEAQILVTTPDTHETLACSAEWVGTNRSQVRQLGRYLLEVLRHGP